MAEIVLQVQPATLRESLPDDPITVALTGTVAMLGIATRNGNHNPCGTVLHKLASRE